MSEIGLFEAIYSTSGMVGVRPDPVEEEKIKRILDAAVRAPSGNNSQPWQFVVVRDPEVKARIKRIVADGANVYLSLRKAMRWPSLPGKIARAATKFVAETDKVPVLIFVCLDNKKGRQGMKMTPVAAMMFLRNPHIRHWAEVGLYGSIFPAMQNLILAARGLGLATRITTFPLVFKGKVHAILGIPKHVEPVAMIYLGYADGPFVTTRRIPSEQSTHYDRW
jgi:nitroreductase